MNWDAIGAIGEVVGAFAVLVTLVYLAVQVRQANELARFSSAKDIFDQFNELNRMVAENAELRERLVRDGELFPDEREQLYNFAVMWGNVWLSSQVAHDNGQLSDELFAAACKDVRVGLDRWPNFRTATVQFLERYPEHAHHEILRPVVALQEQAKSTARLGR